MRVSRVEAMCSASAEQILNAEEKDDAPPLDSNSNFGVVNAEEDDAPPLDSNSTFGAPVVSANR